MCVLLLKAPDDFVELMADLQSCMQKAQERKSKRKKKAGGTTSPY